MTRLFKHIVGVVAISFVVFGVWGIWEILLHVFFLTFGVVVLAALWMDL